MIGQHNIRGRRSDAAAAAAAVVAATAAALMAERGAYFKTKVEIDCVLPACLLCLLLPARLTYRLHSAASAKDDGE